MTKPLMLALAILAGLGAAGWGGLQLHARHLARDAFYSIETQPFDGDNLSKAMLAIDRAGRLNKDEAWVAIARSRALLEVAYRIGNRHRLASYRPAPLEGAETQAERALRLGPEISVAHAQRARIQIIRGDYRTAWGTLNRAQELDDSAFLPWFLHGVIAVRMKDEARAGTAFDEAEERAQRRYQRRILLQKRRDLARHRDDVDALDRLYREEIALDPGRAQGHGNYGTFLVSQGRYDEAIEHLEKALSISPYPAAAEQLQRAHQAR